MKKATTIIELIIYMGILSLILVVMSNFFSSIVNIRLESESKSNVEVDGNYLLARMFYDIARADTIVTPSTNGATANSLQLTIAGVNYTYSSSNNQLQITNDNGADILMSPGTTISNLAFKRIGNAGGTSTIDLSFTLSSPQNSESPPDTKAFDTVVTLRH